ncbi:hypothetical protein SBBP1_260023 [Burkholderiales bacterium]|nr:hypothetical protein SBBP1_260023 [Burkholderiales bacterium]
MSGMRPAGLRRLVLAFPPAAVPQHAIDSAAQLARLMRASLLGLFVEDSDLFVAAQLPFMRELDVQLRAWRPLSHQRLLEDYAASAAALRRQLLQSAAQSGVPAKFAVFRGDPGTTVVSRALPTDFVALFESVTTWPGRPPSQAAGTVFVPRAARPRRGPVVVVCGAAEDLAVEVATEIAADAGVERILVDAAQDRSSAFWSGRSAVRGFPLAAPRTVPTSAEHFLPSGLPPASLVVLTRATLAQHEARLLSIAAARPEPWLVLEQR